jgi:hypothetical protein
MSVIGALVVLRAFQVYDESTPEEPTHDIPASLTVG